MCGRRGFHGDSACSRLSWAAEGGCLGQHQEAGPSGHLPGLQATARALESGWQRDRGTPRLECALRRIGVSPAGVLWRRLQLWAVACGAGVGVRTLSAGPELDSLRQTVWEELRRSCCIAGMVVATGFLQDCFFAKSQRQVFWNSWRLCSHISEPA